MQLTEQQLNEFRALYKRRFGVVLSPQEAQAMAQDLVRLVEIVGGGRKHSSGPDPPKTENE